MWITWQYTTLHDSLRDKLCDIRWQYMTTDDILCHKWCDIMRHFFWYKKYLQYCYQSKSDVTLNLIGIHSDKKYCALLPFLKGLWTVHGGFILSTSWHLTSLCRIHWCDPGFWGRLLFINLAISAVLACLWKGMHHKQPGEIRVSVAIILNCTIDPCLVWFGALKIIVAKCGMHCI